MAEHEDDRNVEGESGQETPALPVWGEPGEPTPEEGEAARVWLAKHGVQVLEPTRLLAIRIGVRRVWKLRKRRWFAIYVGLFVLVMLVYVGLRYLSVLHGVLPYSWTLFVVVLAFQLERWFTVRQRDRHLPSATRPGSSSAWQVLGVGYIAATVITFGGGAALGVAMYVTTPAQTYAGSWLFLLGVSAVACAVVLTDVLRAPARGEDEGSLAVDAVLRREEDAYLVQPAAFAAPVLPDVLLDDQTPAQFTGWLILYTALAVTTQVIGWLTHARPPRRLPPGYYGAEPGADR
jgi:hypothetical protein